MRRQKVSRLDQRHIEARIEKRDSDALPHRSRPYHCHVAQCPRCGDCHAGGQLHIDPLVAAKLDTPHRRDPHARPR